MSVKGAPSDVILLKFWYVIQNISKEYRKTQSTYSISQEICGFCFAVLCCGYTLTDFPYPSGLLYWHCGNLTIAPVPAKQPWWIWINTSCEFIMNDCITTTKQSTTKPCAYFLGYTVPLFHDLTGHNGKWVILLIWWWKLDIQNIVEHIIFI